MLPTKLHGLGSNRRHSRLTDYRYHRRMDPRHLQEPIVAAAAAPPPPPPLVQWLAAASVPNQPTGRTKKEKTRLFGLTARRDAPQPRSSLATWHTKVQEPMRAV